MFILGLNTELSKTLNKVIFTEFRQVFTHFNQVSLHGRTNCGQRTDFIILVDVIGDPILMKSAESIWMPGKLLRSHIFAG